MSNGSGTTIRTSVWAALRDSADGAVTRLLYLSAAVPPGVIALRQVPESFEAASDIGNVALDLAVGYIVGWSFYYLTIWRPRAVAREKVLMLVASQALQIAGACANFVSHIRYAAGAAIPEGPLDRELIKSVVAGLSPSASANMIKLDGSWASLADALDDARQRQEQLASKIERWTTLISVDLLVLIHKLLDASIASQTVRALLRQTERFGGLSNELVKWLEASDDLRFYVATMLPDDLRRAGYDPDAALADRILAASESTT